MKLMSDEEDSFYCDTVFGVGGVQRVLAEVAKRLSEEYEVTILTTDDIRQTRRYDYHRSSVRFVVSHLCSGQYLAAFATEVL